MPANPIKDKVAIVGAASTVFSRDLQRSSASLACEAAVGAIRDAGLGAGDIDGISAASELGSPSAEQMASLLGIPQLSHYSRNAPIALFPIVDAMNAIFSGSCSVALVYQAVLRSAWNSRGSQDDPFRRHLVSPYTSTPESVNGAVGYTAWASRYIYQYRAVREDFGRVAVNGRSNAALNPRAAMREPMTMDDYLAARMIRTPHCLYDMDLPVDGAVAFVLTSAERAMDLRTKPVYLHATATGLIGDNVEDQLPGLDRHGQQVVVEQLRRKSDLWLGDVDVYYPYDGFTNVTLAWLENAGWCGPGEAGAFLEAHWDPEENRVLIDGRIPINSHGGSLSEGATRGAGHLFEAVQQLRNEAGDRQVSGASVALVTPGGFFFNSQGAILRTDSV